MINEHDFTFLSDKDKDHNSPVYVSNICNTQQHWKREKNNTETFQRRKELGKKKFKTGSEFK